MHIAILIFSEPADQSYAGVDRLEEAATARGHSVIRLYEPHFSIGDNELLYDGQSLPQIDVIIARPNFIEEPSLHTSVLSALREKGYRIVNGNASFVRCKNKLEQTRLFQTHNIPHPKSLITHKPSLTLAAAKSLGFPVILKVAFGAIGKGVFYIPDELSCRPIAEYLAIRDRNPVIVQEFIKEAAQSDLRAFVVGGKIIAAMERHAPNGDVRSNTSNGGRGMSLELTKEEHDLALQVTKLFELEIAGVDLIRSDRGPLVLEINANPGFKELEQVSGIDVAGAIVEYAENVGHHQIH